MAGVTSAEYVEFPGGAGEDASGGDGAGREEPCFVRIHSGPKCIVVAVILFVAESVGVCNRLCVCEGRALCRVQA